MAKKQAVWGIDIGLCSIKALRCTVGDQPGEIVADKFDFIEFPKMLNQPEVEAEEEIRDALKQFLARNELKGDLVAISVPGQTGLPRFFRPPPVDARTLPEIVKYEVKQQIPFPIEDVIWDWQRLGGIEVDDRIVDAEVGLFAMKREAVYKALKPFDEAGIEINLIQLSPLSVFNFVTHDVFESLPTAEDFDPENPPESTVVMSMGTDTTDLIVTNGIKLWLRNIPVGGNHFTKQLSREMKLTHAKAEQLKRNVQKAEDPKSILRAMRPVFNDLVNEVQRSLTFFRSIDKNAKLSQIVLIGNSAKLPGIRQFLATQLEMDIVKVSEFKNLSGPDVVGQATFDENMLTFAPVYGLCIQGLKQGMLKTNLLPPEIQEQRIIRAKKPWILAAISMMMLGMLLGWFLKANAWYRSSPEFAANDVSWSQSFQSVSAVKRKSEGFIRTDNELKSKLEKINRLNKEIVSESDRKMTWLELISAINQALPIDERVQGTEAVDSLELPFEDRELLYIEHIESVYSPDLSSDYARLLPYFDSQFEADAAEIEKMAGARTAGAEEGEPEEAKPAMTPQEQMEALKQLSAKATPIKPEGIEGTLSTPGFVIEIRGHHYHNSEDSMMARDAERRFLVRTFISKLANGEVQLPGEDNEVEGGGTYRYSDFGVYYPSLVSETLVTNHVIPYSIDGSLLNSARDQDRGGEPGGGRGNDRGAAGLGGGSAPGAGNSGADQEESTDDADLTEEEKQRRERMQQAAKDGGFIVDRYNFVVQLLWVPRSPAERYAARAKRLEAEKSVDTTAAPAANEN